MSRAWSLFREPEPRVEAPRCPRCQHDEHPSRTISVGEADSDHVGPYCLGCERCMDANP